MHLGYGTQEQRIVKLFVFRFVNTILLVNREQTLRRFVLRSLSFCFMLCVFLRLFQYMRIPPNHNVIYNPHIL